jgi:phosphoribosylamine--glycine ligase
MYQSMKVLVIGSGGREHTIVWKLKKSKKVDKIFCAPGNGGISQLAKCVNIKADNIPALIDFAQKTKINLTIVGPEAPLADGIVDEFQKKKLKIFGPNKEGAQIESSKVFSKEFMRKYHIPTAPFKFFNTTAEAIGFCKIAEYPIVIKADGLAAGKGVFVVKDYDNAKKVIQDLMLNKIFGDAGKQILIESFLTGQEVSIMAFADGKTVVPLQASQDHKQAYDGDKGPNTGGMGAYCPTELVNEESMTQIIDHVLNPTIKGLAQEGITYKGILYAGLMLTEAGPKVLEFNCRFGDPETQAILPLLNSDLVDIMQATINQKLDSIPKLGWRKGSAACIIMASKGYPGKYNTGMSIDGLQSIRGDNCIVFHSGTIQKDNKWLTAGGRVLGVTGIDQNLKLALNRAYQGVNKIKYNGTMYRRDIGFRILKQFNK